MIDNNGYIIISERENDTGKFFGQVEGSVMQTLVDMEIFKVITVYDLQALCAREERVLSEGSLFSTVRILLNTNNRRPFSNAILIILV